LNSSQLNLELSEAPLIWITMAASSGTGTFAFLEHDPKKISNNVSNE
jgi:hypothetical protein